MQDSKPLQADRLRLPFLDEPPAAGATAQAETGKAAAPQRQHSIAPQRRRRKMLRLSALLVIGLPCLLATFYYGLIAANQYAVEVRFAVRGVNGAGGNDLFGIISGLPGNGNTTTDTYIVLDYMKSAQMIDKLDQRIGLRRIYSRQEADWLARLNPAATAEDFGWYWRHTLRTSFDTSSQLAWAEVRAFTPEDAKKVAEGLLTEGEILINDLSVRAREDAVRLAQLEVDRMEARLKADRAAMRTFREQQRDFDPVKNAEARSNIVGGFEDQLSKERAKLAGLKQFMSDDAPSVIVVKNNIQALEKQLVLERAKLGKTTATPSGDAPLASLISQYEDLAVAQDFSEKAYVTALASLERARAEADQQQRYLATFVRPALPEEALYPQRLVNTLTITGACALLWALGVLIVYAIRDHAM